MLSQKWISLEPNLKSQIKRLALDTLASQEQRAGSTAAQVVQAIAFIEIPRNEWPDLIPTLLSNVSSSTSTINFKRATLEAIGFICEEVDPIILARFSNEILTAIIHGMESSSPSPVRLAACIALYNSLEFTRQNFESVTERDYIMKVACEATQCSDAFVATAAFEVLVRVMQLYYSKMPAYMQQGLFQVNIRNVLVVLLFSYTLYCLVDCEFHEAFQRQHCHASH